MTVHKPGNHGSERRSLTTKLRVFPFDTSESEMHYYYQKVKFGVNGNKLVQVWNITRDFYLSPFRRVVNATLENTFYGVP